MDWPPPNTDPVEVEAPPKRALDCVVEEPSVAGLLNTLLCCCPPPKREEADDLGWNADEDEVEPPKMPPVEVAEMLLSGVMPVTLSFR